MEQKRVSFEVAKALKEAGYPQGVCYNLLYEADEPTYLDVWLWLWGRGFCIEIQDNRYYALAKVMNQRFHKDTPEEAIESAIEYLVDNNLIK